MINGYPYEISVFPGKDLILCVSSDTPNFRVNFYRQGTTLAFVGSNAWIDGVHFDSADDGRDWGWKGHSFSIPLDWLSGVYIAMFYETDRRGEELPNAVDPSTSYDKNSKALFVVKNLGPGKKNCILYKIPLFTYHAYNAAQSVVAALNTVPLRV